MFHSLYPSSGYFLLGDGGYTHVSNAPSPSSRPTDTHYRGGCRSAIMCRACSIIKRTFGVMKARWRSTLFKALEVKPAFCSEVFLVCAVLHNVCLNYGVVLEEAVIQPEDSAPLWPSSTVPGEKGSPHQGQAMCPDFCTPTTWAHVKVCINRLRWQLFFFLHFVFKIFVLG